MVILRYEGSSFEYEEVVAVRKRSWTINLKKYKGKNMPKWNNTIVLYLRQKYTIHFRYMNTNSVTSISIFEPKIYSKYFPG